MNIEELRQACQTEKLKTNTGLTLLNRRVSIYFTYFFIKIGMSANQATFSSIVIGLMGSFLLIPGLWWMNLTAILFLWVSLTLDQIDGDLARHYRTVNLNGVYLDEIRHLLIYSVAVFCLSFAPSKQLNSSIPFLLGFGGAVVLILNRIEYRLPYLIFTDRIVMKNNFVHGQIKNHPAENKMVGANELISEQVKLNNLFWRIIKSCSSILYFFFNRVADQCGILVAMLLVFIADHLLMKSFPNFKFSIQFAFLGLFSVSGLWVMSRTIFGHWQEQWIDSVCLEIYSKYDQIMNKLGTGSVVKF